MKGDGTGLTTAEAVLQVRRMLQTGKPSPKIQKQVHQAAPAVAYAAPAAAAASARPAAAASPRKVLAYALACALLTVGGIAAVWNANRLYAPEMYDDGGMAPAAKAFSKGLNYAVFDLNLNIRKLRDKHIALLAETPDVAIFGASHWQEAHGGLVKHIKFYNSHVHRDYWEDMLAVTEIWSRNKRLPKRLIISVRDNLFTPMDQRKDFLWEPGIPYWRAMADQLGLEKESYVASLPFQRMRERFSMSMLFNNVTRWYNASERPHATAKDRFETLDVLLPDGSIRWSTERMHLFTPERAEREALDFAAIRKNQPPKVEKRGVEAFEKLLGYLKSEGVTVYLAQPPFNPIYYDKLQGTPYMEGLGRIEELTRGIAARHGLKIVGGFNPHKVGCDASMYIDAEHSNADCLQKIFDEFSALDKAAGAR
jgi:hypothetical protein